MPFHRGAYAMQPRIFSDEGYKTADSSTAFEETKPYYTREAFYPVRNGETVNKRYQIQFKLGYGTSSTVWLAQGLQFTPTRCQKKYFQRELDVCHQLATHGRPNCPGKKNVCELKDRFELQGPHGTHHVLVLTAAGMSLSSFRQRPGNVLTPLMARLSIRQVLLALNFMHSADVVYTDLHADNLLIGMTDHSVFDKIASLEARTPSTRKYVDGTVIHASLGVVEGIGPLTICDFGQARIGPQHEGIAMPAPFRAPEVILGMPWEFKIDMWNVGVFARNLLEGNLIFKLEVNESQEQTNTRHLAAMVGLLGPPPAEILSRRPAETSKYWDSQGNWIGSLAVPEGVSFESLAKQLQGDERAAFIDFVRSLLRWLPEDRPKSVQAFAHPWVKGGNKTEDTGGQGKKNDANE